MARVNSLLNQVLNIPTADENSIEHSITLADRTKPPSRTATPPIINEPDAHEAHSNGEGADRQGSETAPVAPLSPSVEPLTRKVTGTSSNLKESARQLLARQKYGSYYRANFDNQDQDPDHTASTSTLPPDPEAASRQSNQPKSDLKSLAAKAKTFLTRKRSLGPKKQAPDAVIDVLYENQRGIFIFGVPRYSSASLFPNDPNPWQNALFRTSPVDIRNAQVPDPSWKWVWKNWYVDMSRDVDEEGWEYSFMFKTGHNWHGTHPFFHSFVRRRRWLRMRRRIHATRHDAFGKGEELPAEYFTVHPKTLNPAIEGVQSQAYSAALARRVEEEDVAMEKMEITDIASLMQALRKASIDREKLAAVTQFVADGGDELHYLSERMPDIMQLFIFQSSRRQLLTALESNYSSARARRESLRQHEHNIADAEERKQHDDAVRYTDDLLQAVQAADAQVQRLEFWSDIKGMDVEGVTLRQTENGRWGITRWSGLDEVKKAHEEVFASKQRPREGASALHKDAEHIGLTVAKGDHEDMEAASKKSSTWADAKETHAAVEKDTEDEEDRYTTAAESASEYSKKKGKGKARAVNLDGVTEGEEDGVPTEREGFTRASESAAKESAEQAKVSYADVDGLKLVEAQPLDEVA